jgi:D-glycero-D-manno-heptose 1,7-bisphosphate phosphatase
MVCDTLRDLLAAQAAGCEPHLVRSGRATSLDDAQWQAIRAQVPQARSHPDLGAFVDGLLGAAGAV